eukprot:9758-Heterococcus_DN1.PRE.2
MLCTLSSSGARSSRVFTLKLDGPSDLCAMPYCNNEHNSYAVNVLSFASLVICALQYVHVLLTEMQCAIRCTALPQKPIVVSANGDLIKTFRCCTLCNEHTT